jgi:hypothetical protein
LNTTAPEIFYRVRRISRRYIHVALSVSLLLTPLGCATTGARSFSSPIPEEIRKGSHSVAVTPAGFTPSTNLLTYAKGRSAGAAKGAADGALSGIEALGKGGHSAGPYGAAAIVLLLPIFASIGAIIGGVEGATKAIPSEEVTRIEAFVKGVLQALDMQSAMADHIVFKGRERTSYRFVPLKGPGLSAPEARPDFTSIKGEGRDLALEAGILEIGFLGGSGRDPLLSFFMNARIRAFQANDGTELHADNFRYASPERKFSEWSENEGVRLREALETGYAEIAEAATEKFFLLYEFKVDSIWSVERYCMLKPLDPPQESLGFFGRRLKFPEIDTRHPTLKWESFPRDRDREADGMGRLGKIIDITYELKIWKGKDGVPEELIYRRSGLPAPEHTVETRLQQGTEYFWTVRAHFRLDGQERLTKWAHSRIPWDGPEDPCRKNLIPPDHYHRFKISLK